MPIDVLGISQFPRYDQCMEAEIGARVRARMQEVLVGTSQAEVARRIGLTPDAFSRSLNGKRAFTAIELVELAGQLKTSAHWFITGEPDPFAARVAGRHGYDRENGSYTLERWGEARAELNTVVLAYTQALAADRLLARASAVSASMNADECRAALVAVGGEDFVRRLAGHIESAFEVDIVRISGLASDFVLDVAGRAVIAVNETPNWFRENFGILHELAHILNGDLADLGEEMCTNAKAESRANAFAAKVLMPEASIRSIDWANYSLHDLAELVWNLGVSTDALATRLSGLRIKIPSELVKGLSLKTQALLRRANVPESDRDEVTLRMTEAATRRFPAHLVEAHRVGVSEGILLPDVLAWMLGVDVDSVASELAPPLSEPDIEWLGRELGLLG